MTIHALSRLCRTFLALLCCTLAGTRALADDRATLRLFVQDFYAAYTAAQDTEKAIMKSDKVTPGFKKAYAAFMKKGPDHDPIIEGQDVPSLGYRAGEVELDDTKATVTLEPQDKGFTTLKVHVIWDGKKWLINGVNKLKGK